jgi:hypothetical protein
VHYELRWAVRALLAIGGAEDVLDELLRSPDRNVAEPVLRYADQLGPAIAKGMVHTWRTDSNWKNTVAQKWLRKHAAAPEVIAALADAGLTVEDLKKRKDDDE